MTGPPVPVTRYPMPRMSCRAPDSLDWHLRFVAEGYSSPIVAARDIRYQAVPALPGGCGAHRVVVLLAGSSRPRIVSTTPREPACRSAAMRR